MIEEIRDFDDERVGIYSRLTEAQLRNRLEEEKGIFIAESPKVIEVALDRGYEPLSLLTERRHLEGDAKGLIDRLGDDFPVFTGDRQLLASLTGYELTRGVLCAMRRPKPLSVEEICQGKHRVAVVSGVVNATNIGAIFRAAAALGIEAVVLERTCCDVLNRRSVRVSMGTVFQVPWAYLDETLERGGLERLKAIGYKNAAMALSDEAISIDDPRLKGEERLAIVLGSEGDGLSHKAIEGCDYVAKIPMMNGVDSLNVAAAAAVIFWELRR